MAGRLRSAARQRGRVAGGQGGGQSRGWRPSWQEQVTHTRSTQAHVRTHTHVLLPQVGVTYSWLRGQRGAHRHGRWGDESPAVGQGPQDWFPRAWGREADSERGKQSTTSQRPGHQRRHRSQGAGRPTDRDGDRWTDPQTETGTDGRPHGREHTPSRVRPAAMSKACPLSSLTTLSTAS